MKKRQLKQGVCFGLAVSVLALVLVLIKPELASAYDVVDDIVTVTEADGKDFNAIYDKYKEHSIIVLPKGTYTLSDTLVIDQPVIIRAADDLSADDVIIDGGAKEVSIPIAEPSEADFKHQLHMENPYAMLQGLTLEHFMGFQTKTQTGEALNSYPTVQNFDNWAKTAASAISINGSLDRVKIVKNFMGDEVNLSNTAASLYSPIILINGASISNTLIAYNGYTHLKPDSSYEYVGTADLMTSFGYSRLTNNTMIANNTGHLKADNGQLWAANGDLVLQNNIFLALKEGVQVTGGGTDSRYLSGLLQTKSPWSMSDWAKTALNYQYGGSDKNIYWFDGKWQITGNQSHPELNALTLAIDGAGLKNLELYLNTALTKAEVSAMFESFASDKLGYKNPDGSSNEALTFDFTPKGALLVDQGFDCYYPQIGLDAKGDSRLQGAKPDLGAYESAGDAPDWQIDGVTDSFYITENGAGKKDGSSWDDAYAGKDDIQYGIILAHRAGVVNIYVDEGTFNVHGRPYLYNAYANGYTTTVWDGVILAPVRDSLDEDTTKGMSLYGKRNQAGEPTTRLIGQTSTILTTEVGAFPYGNNQLPTADAHTYRWQSAFASHTARTTYGTRIISQVEPVKGTVDSVVVAGGYVATALPTLTSPRWTISEELANHNLAKGGGGVYLWNGTIKNSVIQNNYEARAFVNRFSCGGGIFLNDSSTMENTKVIGNYSETTGGGVLAAGSNTTVKNSLITGNVAFEDGGGLATGAQPADEQANNPTKIINTVINGNYALGLSWNTADANFRSWQIIPDQTMGRGGGLLLHKYAEVKGTTIADNFAPNGDNVYMTGGLLKNTAIYSAYNYNTRSEISGAGATMPLYLLYGINYYSGSYSEGLNGFIPSFLPNSPQQPSGYNSIISGAQIMKYFVLPRIAARAAPEFVDLAIEATNAEQIKANIQNSAFKNVAVATETTTATTLSKVNATGIGQNSVVYATMSALFANASYGNYQNGWPLEDVVWHATNVVGLPMYVANRSSTTALPEASQLANRGVSDADMLRDYFGDARASNDIGAFTAKVLAGVNYQVSYHKGTNDIVTDLPSGALVTENAAFAIADSVPLRAGYVFSGWQADDADETLYQAGETISSVTRDTVLTAQWRAVHTVSYASGAGDEAIELPAADTVADGADYSISANAPSRAGYRFTGWQAGERIYQPNDKLENVTADVTLTAQWQAAYTVSYQAGTTDEVENVPATATVYLGDDYLISNKTPTREGHVFTGWRQAETETAYQ
ncbi:InlB B-repeat-containing protein, partial [Enterococcus sp. MMGLQ5-1]